MTKKEVPPLTLEDLGIPTPEINREFIKLLDQGEKYIIEQIANIKGELASIRLLIKELQEKVEK